jgi:DNA-directed RNA polymerase specialized sigma24 family protein
MSEEEHSNLSFEEIYEAYFAKMKRFSKEYVLLEEDAENIVHDVFMDLWEKWTRRLPIFQNAFN